MRKVLFGVGLLSLSATVAMAEGKIAAQWNCPKATVAHNLEAGDQANHSYVISQVSCTAAKSDIGGMKEKDGTATQFNEVTGDTSTYHGVFVSTAENGDKVHYTYKGKAKMNNGQVQSASHTFSIVGGTGKFKGAKGGGSCKGTGNADGAVVWNCTGTYKLAK